MARVTWLNRKRYIHHPDTKSRCLSHPSYRRGRVERITIADSGSSSGGDGGGSGGGPVIAIAKPAAPQPAVDAAAAAPVPSSPVTVEQRYDNADRLTQRALSGVSASAVTFGYTDATGQLTTIDGLGGSARIAYDGLGRVAGVTLPGIVRGYTRYPDGRVQQYRETTGTQTRTTELRYRAEGWLATQDGPDGAQAFAYDAWGRLRSESRSAASNGWQLTSSSAYILDGVDNRTHEDTTRQAQISSDFAGRVLPPFLTAVPADRVTVRDELRLELPRNGPTTVRAELTSPIANATALALNCRLGWNGGGGNAAALTHTVIEVARDGADQRILAGLEWSTLGGTACRAVILRQTGPTTYTTLAERTGLSLGGKPLVALTLSASLAGDGTGAVSLTLGAPLNAVLNAATSGLAGWTLSPACELQRRDAVRGAGTMTIDDLAVTLSRTASTTFTYDDLHQLVSTLTDTITTSYRYDGLGHLRERSVDGMTEWSYGYDGLDRMTSASGPDGTTTTCAYAGSLPWRTAITVDGVRTAQVMTDAGILRQTTGGADTLYATSNGHPLWEQTAGFGTLSYQTDGRGQLTGRVDPASSAIRASASYTAFGIRTPTGPQTGIPQHASTSGYRGMMHDTATGLMPMGHRMYDPQIGRFMSQDPARAGRNWYAYCGGDPVNRMDPSGLDDIAVDGGLVKWIPDDGSAPYVIGGGTPAGTALSPELGGGTVDLDVLKQVAKESHLHLDAGDVRGATAQIGSATNRIVRQEVVQNILGNPGQFYRLIFQGSQPWEGAYSSEKTEAFDAIRNMQNHFSYGGNAPSGLQDVITGYIRQVSSESIKGDISAASKSALVGAFYDAATAFAATTEARASRGSFGGVNPTTTELFLKSEVTTRPQQMLLPAPTLGDRVASNYQRYYNEGWLSAVSRFNEGKITIAPGQSWRTVLGGRTDAFARERLLRYLAREGITEGPGGDVLINRWLRDLTGSGAYRIPDVMVPGSRLILDGTIGNKTQQTPQVLDFIRFSGGYEVRIVTPEVGPVFGQPSR